MWPHPRGYAGAVVELVDSRKERDDLLALHRARRVGVKIVTNDRFSNKIGKMICGSRLTRAWVNENVCSFCIDGDHFYVEDLEKLHRPPVPPPSRRRPERERGREGEGARG